MNGIEQQLREEAGNAQFQKNRLWNSGRLSESYAIEGYARGLLRAAHLLKEEGANRTSAAPDWIAESE